MLTVCLLAIEAYCKISISQQVQLVTSNQASFISYPFVLRNGATPILTVLQTIPYAQSFLLTIGSQSRTGFFVLMSVSSGLKIFTLAATKFMYLLIDYELNYFHTVIKFTQSGNRIVDYKTEVAECFILQFIIGLSFPNSQNSVSQSKQSSFARYCNTNWQINLDAFLDVAFNSMTITLVNLNNRLKATGIHLIKYQESDILNGRIVQNLQLGDFCKTNCRVLSGLSRFKSNQKQLYFKMSLLSVNRLQVSDIQVPLDSFVVQVYFLNYPQYLRESRSSPVLPSNPKQYFSPSSPGMTPCDPCFKQIITGVFQCLRLYEYYSASHLSCQPCLDYCSFCSGPAYCTVCTTFSTSSVQFNKCQCDVQYYPHQNRKTCESCQVLCRTCDSVTCFSCSSNSILHSGACLCGLKYFLPTGAKSCTPCQKNCLKCNSQNSCLCPQLRHYTVPYSSDCFLCPTGCQLCSSSSSCSACILEAIVQSGQCRCISQQQVLQGFACVPCNPECLTCYSDNRCSCSKLGQFLSPSGVCYNCSADCLSCASAVQCQKCKGNWILADGRCFEQCPAHSTFSNKTLSCLCDPPYYSRFNQSSLQCYLDGSLNSWSAERLLALVKTQDSARNASRQISNVLSVLLIVGVATLLGDAIESFAILKLHLFYVLPIHPFLDVVFNVFERIFSGDLFGKLIGWLQSQFADLQLSPVNLRLAGYTKKRIFLVNSATFFLQVLGIVVKQLLLFLLRYFSTSCNTQHKPLTRALLESRGLLSCSKTEQLTFVSIQLLSFSQGWTYLFNSLLSLLVVSLILFAQIHRKQPRNSIPRVQALCTILFNSRVILIACFIFFSTSIYLQAIPPILMNSIAFTILLVCKNSMRKYYWIRNLIETGSILTLQVYLLLGAFYSQSRAYSIAVYAIVAVCLTQVACNLFLMVMRLYKLLTRIVKRLRQQRKKKKISQLSKRKLMKYFK